MKKVEYFGKVQKVPKKLSPGSLNLEDLDLEDTIIKKLRKNCYRLKVYRSRPTPYQGERYLGEDLLWCELGAYIVINPRINDPCIEAYCCSSNEEFIKKGIYLRTLELTIMPGDAELPQGLRDFLKQNKLEKMIKNKKNNWNLTKDY